MPILNDERRLYAELHPIDQWDGPCKVTCECGYYGLATTCRLAQLLAWQHDAWHWQGKVVVPVQGELVF